MKAFDSVIINQVPQVAIPFLKKSSIDCIHALLKHIIFSKQEYQFNYHIIYSNGLLSGRLRVAQLKNHDHSEMIKHPLHPVLKELFELDSSLLIDLLQDWELPSAKFVLNQSKSVELDNWLIGLESLHYHFIPISKSISKTAVALKRDLTLAEALILIRDKISIIKLSFQGSFVKNEVDKIHVGNSLGSLYGKLDANNSRIAGSMILLNSSIWEWARVLL
jgi:hypothetical protein